MSRLKRHRHLFRSLLLLVLSAGLFVFGILVLWVSTWKLPDVTALSERKISESTKIYDRTGEVLLYDLHGGARRTVVPYGDISVNAKNATVAIEDSEFWQHKGIRFKAILRAVLSNLFKGNLLGGQGGSTITQQVVKNSLLTNEKKISRKLKEWVLAIRLEKSLNKESILSLYLNEIPYGGTVYGIEEASRSFFGKNSRDLSVAEAAYLAAIPNAPTFYSPYGNNRDKLEARKNLVLRRMLENTFISEKEYASALAEKVAWKPYSEKGIIAPHFVMFVRQYLEGKYGRDALEAGGFNIITTLDLALQRLGEDIVKKYALKNAEVFDAENAALIALDPDTGHILAMVGSRDYFDTSIDGNFNATLGLRQPGSSFKPIVYAQALEEGYTPETIVYDLPIEFSTHCNPDGTAPPGVDEKTCYRPENYDGKYRGPITFRDALAQSINVPAIQALYLAGIKDSLRLAKDMGLETLKDADRYGLTLVLGGGEVRLLDMAGAYGTFAADGVHRTPSGILRVDDKDGNIIEEWQDKGERVLSEATAQKITSILSDDAARAPEFGVHGPLHFAGYDVADKTGTTNDFRDAWVLGYSPTLVVGAWAGNNDNRPMQKKIAAFIVAPMWHEFMAAALTKRPKEEFTRPPEEDLSLLPPILRGTWQGNQTYFVDKYSGKRATEFTPPEAREERAVRSIHSTLYWIDKNNPRTLRTDSPESDPQFPYWEYAVRAWAASQGYTDESASVIPAENDGMHTPESAPRVTFLNPVAGSIAPKSLMLTTEVAVASTYPITRVNFFVNNLFVGSATRAPWQTSFFPADVDVIGTSNELKAVAYDVVENKGEATVMFTVTE